MEGDFDPRRSIVALVSERGAGDKPPVLALAAALRERGHDVRLLCDADLADAVSPIALPTLHLPSALRQTVFYDPSTSRACPNAARASRRTSRTR